MNILSENPDQIPIEQYEAEMERLRAVEEQASKIDVLFNHPEIGPKFEKFLEEVEEDLKNS